MLVHVKRISVEDAIFCGTDQLLATTIRSFASSDPVRFVRNLLYYVTTAL